MPDYYSWEHDILAREEEIRRRDEQLQLLATEW